MNDSRVDSATDARVILTPGSIDHIMKSLGVVSSTLVVLAILSAPLLWATV